ncbi:hypothetical protein FW778_02235 [Ginsengibacter hankyongi]|uniref:Uncharacterized protein n=1 Tax=Ginsengibacter hankyongi TaxID=2607284 RepID=A0A5J5IIM0_9BACT|nr:hypothetical protein [Ginsengibacter hankyongi]KAA9040879.1 hypothetical protein FW778_02235 [Ginsengibacter hankyongi]
MKNSSHDLYNICFQTFFKKLCKYNMANITRSNPHDAASSHVLLSCCTKVFVGIIELADSNAMFAPQ